MGRRSTKTTKAGKFMNPTDQWRKQQRKRELKKNKKTRQVVREAVLRMKDVGQMLEEIEEIEKVEIEALGGAPQPNEKGLQEKKRKLHGLIHRVAQYYQREEPKKAHEIKLMIMESENRRREMAKVYNSYRAARSQYSIDEIPMPDTEEGEMLLPSDIPMPSAIGPDEERRPPGLIPPGPPPGPPPKDLPDYNVIESGAANKSVRFAGLDSDSEDSEGGSSSEGESGDEGAEEDDEYSGDEDYDEGATTSSDIPPGPPPGLPPGVLPVPPMVRAPPPAPPGPPPLFGQRFPPRVGLPPGPPPGVPPPQFGMPPKPLIPPNPSRPHIQSGAILSAPPTRKTATDSAVETSATKPGGAIISAQPQLRNMTAEVTKFMPTSLRVRRDQPTAARPKPRAPVNTMMQPRQLTARQTKTQPKGMQGDAYEAFMKEMQGLL